jgi:ubiquinol-cytochrome c reductase cytochrome c1 subunit
MKHMHYRDLHALGFSEDEVKAIASQFEVTDGPNDEGQMFQRKGRPSDQFAAPFANDKAARAANNGALPPDLSLMVKARAHGADYVYAVLTGYGDPPAGVTIVEGMSYNQAFPGNQIAMPPILVADAVTFADGSKATVEQMSKDVANFLAWTAEPELEARKRMGWKVILFMLVFTPMLYAVKRRIWSALH